MPVQKTPKTDKDESYFHLYNKGIESRNLFNDEADYQTFISFLKDYLAPPPDPEKTKKTFSIKGRTYKGVPHQPKNYFNKIQLLAYSLKPDHFHLLLCQKTKDSLERFMKSLSTRYAIYYNKKYQRKGPIFIGPYKSTKTDKLTPLLYLTHHLHQNPQRDYSSYQEYLGLRKTSWLKPKVILSFFERSKDKIYQGDYKSFVEKHDLTPEQGELLESVLLEKGPQDYEQKAPAPVKVETPATAPTYLELSLQPKVLASLAASATFCLLFYAGLKNVQAFETKVELPPLSPVSLVSKMEEPEVLASITENDEIILVNQAEAKTGTRLVVKTGDESVEANIRQDPSTDSITIDKAKDGDTFEFISMDSDWYQIKLADGKTGFISTICVEEITETNEE